MQIINKFISPNYSSRPKEIKYIILHFTQLSFKNALHRLCDPSAEVSCHYLIKATGDVFQLVGDHHKAWHAGSSYWQGDANLNDSSIGIEIDNLGNNYFTRKQINSCIELCNILIKQHNIAPSRIIGHSDIAPDRKIDPGIFFNWQKLASSGLGIWPGKKYKVQYEILLNFGDEGQEVKLMQLNLGKVGYKVDVTGKFDNQTNFIVRAFQSHFNPIVIKKRGIEFYQDYNSKYPWDTRSKQILADLVQNS